MAGKKLSADASVAHLESLEPRLLLAVSLAEQEFVWWLNYARHDPPAYTLSPGLNADLASVAAKQPLAVNDQLFDSSEFHANEMATNNYFNHTSEVTGDQPNKMVRDAGYPLVSLWSNLANDVESIAAGFGAGTSFDSGRFAVDFLIEDKNVPSLGHRKHLLEILAFDNTEIGAGYVQNNGAKFKNYWVAHLAHTDTPDVFLTGVVYNDSNNNRRYDRGEGMDGVGITGGGALQTTTNAAGGWSIKVDNPNGQYTVTANGGGFQGLGIADVTMTGQNVEVDFIDNVTGSQINFDPYVPPDKPDLAIDPPADTNLTVIRGSQVSIPVTVRNIGTDTVATSTVGFYLSNDTNVTTADTLLGQFASGELLQGGTGSDTINFTAPAEAGTYYLGAIADVDDVGDELSESNNFGGVITLETVTGPDLQIGEVVYVPGVYYPGDSLGEGLYSFHSQQTTLTLLGQNVTVAFHLSDDMTWDDLDDILLGTDTFPWPSKLQTGQLGERPTHLSVPAEAPVGNYYLGVQINSDGAVNESDDTNNVSWSAEANIEVTNDKLLGGKRKATYLDANGDLVTVKLNGPGAGRVVLSGPGGDAVSITLTDTTIKSSLKGSVKKRPGGDGRITVQNVLVTMGGAGTGALKNLILKYFDIGGDVLIDGSLGKAIFGNIADNHRFELRRNASAAVDPKALLALKAEVIKDLDGPGAVPLFDINIV